jgi:hypothetical protein
MDLAQRINELTLDKTPNSEHGGGDGKKYCRFFSKRSKAIY